MAQLLRGCSAKISRADECTKNLVREIRTFVDADPKPYVVTKGLQNDAKDYVFSARSVREVPDRFSVLAGEVIHHLRSSLDHLFCALVVKNKSTVRVGHQFPIFSSKKEFRKACEKGALQDVSASAQTLLANLQPCNASPTPNDTILEAVRELNNLDKHQLLIVTATAATVGENIRIGRPGAAIKDVHGNIPAITGFGAPATVEVTKEGKEFFRITLATPTPDFEADADVAIEVAFAKCGLAKLIDVSKVLPGMVAGVVHTINEFRDEFDADNCSMGI